jgi:molecular chaperone GrpE
VTPDLESDPFDETASGQEEVPVEEAEDSSTDSEEDGEAVGWDESDVALIDVAALSSQRDEYLNALQRTQADFENYRKRVLRQQEEHSARAAVDLVGKLLPVLDALDLAVAHLDTHEGDGQQTTEAQALRQARSLLIDVLAKEGLARIDEDGVSFDPSVHDAVSHSPAAPDDPGDDQSIDEVLRAGYRWRGQTLRPAMVRVKG